MKDLETISLIARGLIAMPDETEWLEFKANNADPDAMGERICALSNMALLKGKSYGYLIWGINDKTHEIVGTKLSFKTWKKGDQDILAYWKNLLSPSLQIQDYEIELDGHRVLILEIPAASSFATSFKKQVYCRIGSYNKNAKEYPALEKELWSKLDGSSPELRLALEDVKKNELSALLDLNGYANSLSLPMGMNDDDLIARFVREGFLLDRGMGNFAITKLGALLFGKEELFLKALVNKELRIVRYEGKNRLETKGRQSFAYGYASSFEDCFKSILSYTQIPDSFVNGIRKDCYLVPTIAIREALGNLLIHQDLLAAGGPLVEIFADRIEFSNPGKLNVAIDRLIDSAPSPVNERLASFLRRINIGDTAGSGYDKIVASLEKEHLPPVKVESTTSGVKVTLFSYKPFDDYDSAARIEACYDHVVLAYLSSERASNKSLRERFGLDEDGKFKVSRVIAGALKEGRIKKVGSGDKKDASYIPYWA